MAAVSRDEVERLLGLERLRVRDHPKRGDKVQYRFEDNAGHWRWGPRAVRRAPSWRCSRCRTDMVFVQDGNGTVYSVCSECQQRYAEWWPARAYEVHRDGNARWRRAVRAVTGCQIPVAGEGQ